MEVDSNENPSSFPPPPIFHAWLAISENWAILLLCTVGIRYENTSRLDQVSHSAIHPLFTALNHDWSMNYLTHSSLSLPCLISKILLLPSPHGWVDGRMTFPSFSLIIFTVHYPLDHKVNPLSLSNLLLSLSNSCMRNGSLSPSKQGASGNWELKPDHKSKLNLIKSTFTTKVWISVYIDTC